MAIETCFDGYSFYKDLPHSSPIYKISNLSIKMIGNDEKESKHFSENAYLLDLDVVDSFFHFLNDSVGNFLALMNHVESLNCFVLIRDPLMINKISIGNMESDNQSAYRLSAYVFDVLNKLDSLNIQISFLNMNNYKNVSFDNVFLVRHEFNSYIDLEETGIGAYCGTQIVVPLLKKFLMNDETSTKNNKIFITRKSENSKTRIFRKRMDIIKQKYPNGVKRYKQTIGIGNFEKIEHRFISIKDEEMLEDFFQSKGYKVINPGLLTLKEQQELFYSADIVAGLSGAAFINTIFCNPAAKIIILNTSTGYSFDHDAWPKTAGLKVINIPELVRGGNEKYSSEKLINILNNIPDL